MRQITVFVDNKVGALASICELLGGSGVNLEAIAAYGENEGGVIRVVTEDVETAKRVLAASKYRAIEGEVATVRINDSPGELGKLARRIANAGVNIECIYLLSKSKGTAEFAIKPAGQIEKLQKAIKGI
jgi:hypothetical protein